MLVERNSLELRQSVEEVFSITAVVDVSVQISLLEVIIVKV